MSKIALIPLTAKPETAKKSGESGLNPRKRASKIRRIRLTALSFCLFSSDAQTSVLDFFEAISTRLALTGVLLWPEALCSRLLAEAKKRRRRLQIYRRGDALALPISAPWTYAR